MKIRNKKGMSALIETVLIIGFTIVLAAMIIGWGGKLFKGMQSDTQKTAEFSRLCTAADVDYKAVQESATANLTFENNAQTPVEGFLVIAKSNTGGTDSFLVGSSVMDKANTQLGLGVLTANINPNPFVAAQLGAFAKLSNVNLAIDSATNTNIDIRPVVKTVTGDYHVCENEQTITIIPA